MGVSIHILYSILKVATSIRCHVLPSHFYRRFLVNHLARKLIQNTHAKWHAQFNAMAMHTVVCSKAYSIYFTLIFCGWVAYLLHYYFLVFTLAFNSITYSIQTRRAYFLSIHIQLRLIDSWDYDKRLNVKRRHEIQSSVCGFSVIRSLNLINPFFWLKFISKHKVRCVAAPIAHGKSHSLSHKFPS